MRAGDRICAMWTPLPYNSEPAMTAYPSNIQPQDRDDLPGMIMVVDDNCEAGTALAELLALSDHQVQLFTNGRTALHAIEQHQPDLIILDVQLPDMDGYAVCDAIRHNSATWQIPVIMVTVEGQRAGRLLGIEAGADDYLQKPIDIQELEVRIRSLLRKKRRSDQ